MKDILKREMTETIGKRASYIYKLIQEGVEVKDLKEQMTSHQERLDSYFPTIIQLGQTFEDKNKKLVYCHEFAYKHDWLTHAREKCNVILKTRISLRKEVEDQMSLYLYPLKF